MAFAVKGYKLDCTPGVWYLDLPRNPRNTTLSLSSIKKFISNINNNDESPFGSNKLLDDNLQVNFIPKCPHFGNIKKCNSVIYNEIDDTWSYMLYYIELHKDFNDIKNFFKLNIPFDNSVYEDIDLTEKLFEELLSNPVKSANKR
jgi:hypothetical protein